MKKVLSLLIAFVLTLSTNTLFSQSLYEQDSIAFNKYLNTTFEQYFPLSLLQRIYSYRHQYELGNKPDSISVYIEQVTADKPADYARNGLSMNTYTDTEMVGTGGFMSWAKFDNIHFPDSLKIGFKSQYALFKKAYPRKKVAKKELVSQLQAFEQMATQKPTFFAEIKKSYNGNIKAYVDDLFDKSFLLDGTEFQRFLRKPSAFKLANDMGVQFIVGINLYRLWLKQEEEKGIHQK